MAERNWFSPFEAERRIGTVLKINADGLRMNLPGAGKGGASEHFGHRIGAGEVGEFVFVDCGRLALLGRIVEVGLAEQERRSLEGPLDSIGENCPSGTVQLLTSVDAATGEVFRGVSRFPRVGALVYSANPELVSRVVQNAFKRSGDDVRLVLGELAGDFGAEISVTPEQLFGRHCAVLGATGGGKSNTLARLVELIREHGGKAILIDATGEYKNLSGKHVSIGGDGTDGFETACFSYLNFTESDLFALFTPSPQAQQPKLTEAIRSLKLVGMDSTLGTESSLKKRGQKKNAYLAALLKHDSSLKTAKWSIQNLPEQIRHECIWPTGSEGFGKDKKTLDDQWGDENGTELGHCTSLISRVRIFCQSDHFDWFLKENADAELPSKIDAFLKSGEEPVLVIGLNEVSFEFRAREILVNAIGRYLLNLARQKKFKDEPLIVLIDEAHQFLNKKVGDENYSVSLDAFGSIAKEGRKYGLHVVIATQRPRDIPEDVLSQIGTQIVHRLTNHHDREVVERASGDIDRAAARFLPLLRPGEALLLGVDFPFPLSISISRPKSEPDSRGSKFSSVWHKSLQDKGTKDKA